MTNVLPFKGIVLDMDGVITDTRKYHFQAWKSVFDGELKKRGLRKFSEADYQLFVDGKTREEGIKSFFSSVSMNLSQTEIAEIGNRKNQKYLTLLEESPPKPYQDFIEAAESWLKQDITLMAISSSRNCRQILEQAGVRHYFKTIVDGSDGLKRHLKSKPAPDYFFQAAKENNLPPESCAIVEDSIAGLRAGVEGQFRYVFGISRPGQTPPQELYENGADSVFASLLEIGFLKNPLDHWSDFKARIGSRDVSLFLDFDGTLAEIEDNPKDAFLSPSMKDVLDTCSKSFKVSIISGRDRLDVKERVQIESIFYSGCHGLDISGPGCFHFQVEEVSQYLPELEEASLLLSTAFSSMKGILIERKQLSTAVHYRMAKELGEERIKEQTFQLLKKFQGLKIKPGKKVLEILPNLTWNKSHAVNKISEILNIDPKSVVPIYIGDDITDEDVFSAYRRKGIGIKICDTNFLNNAHYKLKNPGEVEAFLALLSEEYAGKEKRWKPGL